MKHLKRIVFRIFFVSELVFFIGIYIFGPSGIKSLLQVQNENEHLKTEIVALQQEVTGLERNIAQWHTRPFYKEKIAREQLQMACKDEEIYIVS